MKYNIVVCAVALCFLYCSTEGLYDRCSDSGVGDNDVRLYISSKETWIINIIALLYVIFNIYFIETLSSMLSSSHCTAKDNAYGSTIYGTAFGGVKCRSRRNEVAEIQSGVTMENMCTSQYEVSVNGNQLGSAFSVQVSYKDGESSHIIYNTDLFENTSPNIQDITELFNQRIIDPSNFPCGSGYIVLLLKEEGNTDTINTEEKTAEIDVVRVCQYEDTDLSLNVVLAMAPTVVILDEDVNLLGSFLEITNHGQFKLPPTTKKSPLFTVITVHKKRTYMGRNYIDPDDVVVGVIPTTDEIPPLETKTIDFPTSIVFKLSDASLCGNAEIVFTLDPLDSMPDTYPDNNSQKFDIIVECPTQQYMDHNRCIVIPDERLLGTSAYFYQNGEGNYEKKYVRYMQYPNVAWHSIDPYRHSNTIMNMGKLKVLRHFLEELRTEHIDICSRVSEFTTKINLMTDYKKVEFSQAYSELMDFFSDIETSMLSSIVPDMYPAIESQLWEKIKIGAEIALQNIVTELNDMILVQKIEAHVNTAKNILIETVENNQYADKGEIYLKLLDIVFSTESIRAQIKSPLLAAQPSELISLIIENIYHALIAIGNNPASELKYTDCLNDNEVIRYIDLALNDLHAFALEYLDGQESIDIEPADICQQNIMKWYLYSGGFSIFFKDTSKTEYNSGCRNVGFERMPNVRPVYWRVKDNAVFKSSISVAGAGTTWYKVADCTCKRCI